MNHRFGILAILGLLRLNRSPLHTDTGQEGGAGTSNSHVVCISKTSHIGVQDRWESTLHMELLQDLGDLAGATVYENLGWDAGSVIRDTGNYTVLEGGLAYGDEDSPT
jgi:hypothetical protein